jgi:hypothetical protein
VSDTSPAEPRIFDIPDLTGVAEPDPVILLHDMVRANALAMNALSQQGVELRDSHSLITSMITQAFLEAVLQRLGGEEAVVAVGIAAHEQIATVLEGAKTQVTHAQLTAPPGASAAINGNRATRRGR